MKEGEKEREGREERREKDREILTGKGKKALEIERLRKREGKGERWERGGRRGMSRKGRGEK